MEGFALRDAGDEARAPLALRPVHLALVAFVVTLPAYAPTMGAFAEAPQFEAVADVFLFALFLAAVTSSAVVLLRGLQRPRKVFSRARVTAIAAVAYLLGTMGVLGLLFAPAPLPAAAVGAGLLAGTALPLLVAEWARAVAVPIDQALVLCAFVVLTASFVGWILAAAAFGARSRALPAARGGSRRASGGRPRGRPGASPRPPRRHDAPPRVGDLAASFGVRRVRVHDRRDGP